MRQRIAATLLLLAGALVACPGADPCADGEHLDDSGDEARCVPVACGNGPWGDLAGDPETLYVAPDGSDSGAGSEEDPLASIQLAADRAGANGRVAVAEGIYLQTLVLGPEHDDLTVAGRCRDLTVVDASNAEGDITTALGVSGARATLQDLTATGADRGAHVHDSHGTTELALIRVGLLANRRSGLLVQGELAAVRAEDLRIEGGIGVGGELGFGLELSSGGSLDATRLMLRDNRTVGALVVGGTLTARDSAIVGTRPRDDGERGRGLVVAEGGVVEADGLEILGNSETGVLASDAGTRVTLANVRIADTQPLPSGAEGRGVTVQQGAELTVVDAVVEGNSEVGVLVVDPGTVATLERVVVRSTLQGSYSLGGSGLEAGDGASVVASSLELADNLLGVWVRDVGTTVALSDSLVRDGRLDAEGEGGRGAWVGSGGQLTASDTDFLGNVTTGVTVSGGGARATLVRAEVRDTQPDADGTKGRGLVVQLGAELVLNDVVVDGNHDLGILMDSDGSSTNEVELIDVVVSGTKVSADGSAAGMVVKDTNLTGIGVTLERNTGTAIRAADGSSIAVTDLTITGTRPDPDGSRGYALELFDATATFSNVLIEDNTSSGVVLFTGADATFVDAVVRATRLDDEGKFGRGVTVQGGSITATDLVVEDCHDAGILLLAGGAASLERTTVARTGPLADGRLGYGVVAIGASSLEASELVLSSNHKTGLFLSESSTATLSDVLVEDTLAEERPGGSVGFTIQGNSTVEAEALVVRGSEGPGLYLSSGGTITCTDCELTDNAFAGLTAVTGTAELRGGRIAGTRASSTRGGGVGVFAWRTEGLGPRVVLDDVVVEDLPGPALYLRGRGTYIVRGGSFDRVASAAGPFGAPAAVLAAEGVRALAEDGTGLLLQDVAISGVDADAVLLDASAATLDGVDFQQIAGTPLYMQHCDHAPGPVEFVGDPPEHNDCAGPVRLIEPLLEWLPIILEPEAIE